MQVMKLSVWLALLTAIFVPLERWFALKASPWRRAEIGNDLAYYFINNIVPAMLLALPLAALATLLQHVVPAGFYEGVRALPLWVSIPLGLVVADIGAYWGHRLSHEIPWLWRFHAVHHSAEHIDFMVNSRAHPIDMVVTRLFGLVPLYMLGLGSAGAAGSILPAVIAIIGTLAAFFVHANVRWRLGPIEQLVATPAFHHWHHTRTDHINRNYAATFPWIDRLFGSFYLPAHWPDAYGIPEPLSPTLSGQLLAPFTRSEPVVRPVPIGGGAQPVGEGDLRTP
ncbi:sterol desaturase family protein [Glacieibacterium frigidum]|uniref:Sterol desaturase family protein n=2 Tax=Glacieibacterium frigidum TaxID=2593303 RepID=A0A552UAV4_9SPHN|nr:sterol desaturase family protein [Glacieibacterium frigidum]